MTGEDILYYSNFGIYILEPIMRIDEFNSFFYDAAQGFFAILLTVTYRYHYNDSFNKDYKVLTDDKTKKLLHPIIDSHTEKLCWLALAALAIETIFVPTIIQAFILLVIIVKMGIWAYKVEDKEEQLRYMILNFS